MSRVLDAFKVLAGKAKVSSKAINPFDRPSRDELSSVASGARDMAESRKLNTYTQLPWLAIGLDCITRDCANQEYYFCDSNKKEIPLNKVPDDVLTPFRRDFNGIGFRDIMRMIVPHKKLTGNAFIYKIQTGPYAIMKDIQDAFVPIVPDWLFTRIHQGGLGIQEYIINFPSGMTLTAKPSEMIHFKQNTIFDPWWGVGDITKMRIMAEGMVNAETQRSEFMKKKAMPGMVITEKSNRTAEEHDRINDLIRSKTEGARNSGRTLYMAGEDVKVYTVSMSAADMQYMEKEQFDMQTTLSMVGVPPVVAGIPGDTNRSNGETMRLSYLANTCNPLISELASSINQQHVNIKYPNIFFNFKKHTTADVALVKDMLLSGMITPNRASEMVGESVDLTDVSRSLFYIPATYIPTTIASQPYDSVQQVDDSSQGTEDTSKKKILNSFDVEHICDHFTKSATKPKLFQVKYIRASLKSRNAIEAKYTDKVAVFFEDQKARVLSAVAGKLTGSSVKADGDEDAYSASLIFDIDQENKELIKMSRSMHTSGVQRSISDIGEITSIRLNQNLSNPLVLNAVNSLGNKITGTVNQTTLKELQGLLVSAVDEAWSLSKIQDEIQDKFTSFQGYRARMIARTEARAAWDAGAKIAYTQIGVQTVDIVGCTKTAEEEGGGDCGRQGIPVMKIDGLDFHPNHIGTPAPSEEI